MHSPTLRRVARLAAALSLALGGGACASPLGGRDLDLGLSAQTLPGVGAGVSLSQRVARSGPQRIDFEAGVDRQDLADAGPSGDAWTRVWAGLSCAEDVRETHLVGRAGVNWLRTEGKAGRLEDPGDYGGVYAGLGLLWEVAPALSTGPDLTLMFVDAEGTRSGSGGLATLAWRWVWHL